MAVTTLVTAAQLPVSELTIDLAQPLRGVVLCCTAISPEKRSDLSQRAEQMGATHIYDLTSQVTHLIVGEYDTPKYRYVAKERSDIKVILPSFIDELSDRWKADEPFDLAQIELEHTRLALTDLKISLTGFESIEERQQIAEDIVNNGGLYSGDLTKQTTHLIALRPEGQKHKYAKTWGKHIVTVDWLRQSIERGMVLDETLFNLDIPAGEQGQGAWTRRQQPRSPLGKRSRDVAGTGEKVKRKLRRTLSTKLNSQQDQIWGDIVGGSAATTPLLGAQQWESLSEPQTKGVLQVSRSMVMPQPELATQRIADIQPLIELTKGGAFDGCRMLIHGFCPRHENVLRKHIISYDAEVVTSRNDLMAPSPTMRRLVIVPHDLAAREPSVVNSTDVELVTEFWVERCMEGKIFIEPRTYQLGIPFPKYPLPGFENLTLCSTGLVGVQILHMSKVVKLLGAKYEENFSAQHSALIFSADRQIRAEKLQFAKTYQVPLVSMEWLFESIRLGAAQSFKTFSYHAAESQSRRPVTDVADRKRHEALSNDPVDTRLIRPRVVRPTKGNRSRSATSMDTPAFEQEVAGKVKEENHSQSTDRSSKTSQTSSAITVKPLREISPNSSRKHPASVESVTDMINEETCAPKKDISNAVSSLLANAKHTTLSRSDTADTSVKRRQNRILGRAASNVSAASARDSRASSVDSTASTGRAVDWSSGPGLKKTATGELQPRSSNMTFMPEEDADRERAVFPDAETQPRSTQIGYLDSESTNHRDKVLARLNGKKVPDKRHLEKVATVASLDATSTENRRRNLRNR